MEFRLALILILTMRLLQKFANDSMCCDGMCKICSDLMAIKEVLLNGSVSPFYIYSWARSQPMREAISYVTSSIIGWKLAPPWIEAGPWSNQPVIIFYHSSIHTYHFWAHRIFLQSRQRNSPSACFHAYYGGFPRGGSVGLYCGWLWRDISCSDTLRQEGLIWTGLVRSLILSYFQYYVITFFFQIGGIKVFKMLITHLESNHKTTTAYLFICFSISVGSSEITWFLNKWISLMCLVNAKISNVISKWLYGFLFVSHGSCFTYFCRHSSYEFA